jgi:dihydroxyacetone kinase phosphoprotein-dependent L subunit
MSEGDVAVVADAIETIARCTVSNEQYFCELDAVVGDGDFGYSLARGFEVVLEEWGSIDRSSVDVFLRKVALAITGRMGGTSGPLWGTAFLRAASAFAESGGPLDGKTAVAMLRAAISGIEARGGAKLGDKTLLDALIPATDEIDKMVAAGAGRAETIRAAAAVAREAADATSALRAARGRASYTGERSIGSVDAGAIAVAVLFEALAALWPAQARSEMNPSPEAVK